MTPERLRRIRAFYEAALQFNAAEREDFLSRECGSDQDLRNEVERLLAAREHLPDWLSLTGRADAITEPIEDPFLGMEGRELRGYKLIREIGHGGMGSVYLAERADGAYQKQVAVKLVRAGKDNGEIIRQFQREREILASLDHPNIARLIDGGSTEEGLPYFVMEYIEGLPIQRWCDEHKLNVSQRLELFRGVCAAVQYAHQHLIVHCDLKPRNILVTADGTVKLLDFGIARLVKRGQIEDREATVTLLMAMTPEYASPEQVRGQAVSTLTDVYCLGVVLYELLTGRRPYNLLNSAIHEIARVIAEEEPTRPSEIVTVPPVPSGDPAPGPAPSASAGEACEGDVNRLRKRLRGDLDCILLTALRKEPARRYSSVESFSEDLRRHLDHLPVSAREDSLLYRARKFVRRHPGGIATAGIIAVSLGAALLTMLWELRIALETSREHVSARTILAPQFALWAFWAVAAAAGIAYLTRARRRRIAGALAGGLGVAAVRWLGIVLVSSMGWWRGRFAEGPDPIAFFSEPALFFTYALSGAIGLLAAWRLVRRFGAVIPVALLAFLGVGAAVRERIWYDRLLHVLNVPFQAMPLLADAAFWASAFALGYIVMRAIVGPAGSDRLARS